MRVDSAVPAWWSSRRFRGRRGVVLALGSVLLALVGTSVTTGTAHADNYGRLATTDVAGRTITLWFNYDNHQWHGEISGASPGDRIHLDYTTKASEAKPGGNYSIASATVASGNTYANTSDHEVPWARACGFVGTSSKACTDFLEFVN